MQEKIEAQFHSNRRDRNPCLRLIPPSLKISLVCMNAVLSRFDIPSSFSSSGAAASSPPAAAAPPAAGAAAAPPPAPTFSSRSLTSFPSSA
jgi:hypothetical protein